MDWREQIDVNRLPRHVAIIMDGNGRWAKQRGYDRSFGHENGVTTVRRITEIASELGLQALTLYTFSTENWNRPPSEVDLLMHLVVTAIEEQTPDLIRNNVHLVAIGDLERMPDFARERLQRCMADTAHCNGLTLCLALSYSSRWELVKACQDIAREVKQGTLDIDDIDDNIVANHLATASLPDPDLLIRTGGDLRVSNYLLWQIAYSELYFTDTFWPDFTQQEFCKAIVQYQKRERRFGMTSEQICHNNGSEQ